MKIRHTILLNKRGGAVGSGSKEVTLGAALIDSQGSAHGYSSLSATPLEFIIQVKSEQNISKP